MLLTRQSDVSNQRGMPVDDMGASQFSQTISSETIQFYYSNSGTRTADAGQAAGVLISAKLAYGGIKNADGSMQATNLDTSLSFTSTALTSEIDFPWERMEAADASSWASRLAAAGEYLTTNGQYFVDYKQGIIYGRKASTQSSATAGTYIVNQNVSGGGSGTASTVNTQAAATSSSGTVSVGTSAGGTQVVAANSKRQACIIQNNGSVDIYVGAGTVTSSFVKLVGGGSMTWISKEAIKALSSSGSVSVAFCDFTNP